MLSSTQNVPGTEVGSWDRKKTGSAFLSSAEICPEKERGRVNNGNLDNSSMGYELV